MPKLEPKIEWVFFSASSLNTLIGLTVIFTTLRRKASIPGLRDGYKRFVSDRFLWMYTSCVLTKKVYKSSVPINSNLDISPLQYYIWI